MSSYADQKRYSNVLESLTLLNAREWKVLDDLRTKFREEKDESARKEIFQDMAELVWPGVFIGRNCKIPDKRKRLKKK